MIIWGRGSKVPFKRQPVGFPVVKVQEAAGDPGNLAQIPDLSAEGSSGNHKCQQVMVG